MVVSDRVSLYSKNDSSFIFGKESVGLSSKGTINLDADIYTAVFSKKIYLGNGAESENEPVILGKTMVDAIQKFCDTMYTATVFAQAAGPGNDAAYKAAFEKMNSSVAALKSTLNSTLSKTTFVK